ncbi:MAG: hypothetical protein QMD78_02595, partial [Methanocellales archaeon]|nr:hypothetical protein [Methanocellales archaeon]
PGGRAVKAPVIENFPGFPEGITGADLVSRMAEQTEKFGVEMRFPEKVIVSTKKANIKLVHSSSPWVCMVRSFWFLGKPNF